MILLNQINMNEEKTTSLGTPSPKAQSWGAVISIVVIVGMIVIGAFYAWGKRIAQENALVAPTVNNNY